MQRDTYQETRSSQIGPMTDDKRDATAPMQSFLGQTEVGCFISLCAVALNGEVRGPRSEMSSALWAIVRPRARGCRDGGCRIGAQ
jgi:hypothetical protein